MPSHPLANYKIGEYYENEPRFNGVYARYNLPKTIKNGAYVINLDKYADVGTHWIACCLTCIKMESQNIVKLLNNYANEYSTFPTRKGTLLMTKIMDNTAEV